MLDLRQAFRRLARAPGFTALSVATLALGIGACTAIFTVVSSVLLRPLPYPQSARLIALTQAKLPELPVFSVSSGHYFAWVEQARSFERLTALSSDRLDLTGLGSPVRVSAARVTANMFATFRTPPALGRGFSADEERPGGGKVVVLGHGFWLRQLGGRPDVVGRTVRLDGRPFTIVGVMPPGFRLGGPPDLYLPIVWRHEARQDYGSHEVYVFGRLAEGATLAQARQELTLIGDRLAAQYPDARGWGVTAKPMLEQKVGGVRPLLLTLLAAVGFLLLIACANVANLLLVRTTARSREIAVHVALGASRGRVIRQLLTESVILALLGSLGGVVLAEAGTSALVALAPQGLPRLDEIAVDGRALGFALSLALCTALGFGLVPAWQATGLHLGEALKEGRGTGGTGGRQRLQSAIVVLEVAIALVLLAGAGLLGRSLSQLQDVHPGFEPAGAFAAEVILPPSDDGPPQARFVDQALARLGAIPGVEAVAAASVVPFSRSEQMFTFAVGGRPPLPPDRLPSAQHFAVTPGYFKALGIALRRGRPFGPNDRVGAAPVAIISESIARTHFAGADPLGKRLLITNVPESWREIVGVVANVKHERLDEPIAPQVYEPLAQQPAPVVTFVVRAAGANLTTPIRDALARLNPGQPAPGVEPVSGWVVASTARRRFAAVLFGVFSAVALLLAAIGVYGVMAYTVAQRTAEIGLRKALGAQTGAVLALVLRRGARLVLLGVAAGVGGALCLTRFVGSLLYGVSPHDPATFAAMAALLAAVAALACLLPARRAATVDPTTALRSD